ncbi:MAG: hypothetical protein NWE94_01675 [Candidatus Bathyarchaeota archaeon]|nr:hypothetical protein [Candidatus Bathyarchaeota archaeon]
MTKRLFKLAYPPPPPPPPTKTGSKRKTGIISAAVVAAAVIIIVMLLVFNIIPWRPGTINPTPTPSPTPTPTGGTSIVTYGVLIGTVVDTSGSALSDVTVSISGKTSSTNDQGWFSVANVLPGSKQVVKFTKNGYATTYKVTNIYSGESNFVEVTLSPADTTVTFDAAQGITITTVDNARLVIAANSLRTLQNTLYTGMAEATVTSFDPSNEMEANAFPGEYLGKSAADQTISPIKSFGFMEVSITSQSGEQLQLASGQNATIQIKVPYSMQSEAAALGTCPMWYFDPATGVWQEEGQGTYDAASGSFTGTVSHFSTWNFDIRYPAAYVSGRVVDSNGNPVQGAQVKCWGTGWYQQRWASGETETKADGTFTRIPVEVGVTFKYQASKGGHKSTVFQAGPLVQNEEYNVGDIVIDAPVIQITLTWGLTPEDLDSHLAAKLDGGGTFHVYYWEEGSLTSTPFANLDTDDTDSYGPEVISISKLRPGTYQYSVRHFDGEGKIATSNAEVNLVIPNKGIYRFTPPSNQPSGTDIWIVFSMVIDSTGKVTTVNTINSYVTGGDDSTLLYPP